MKKSFLIILILLNAGIIYGQTFSAFIHALRHLPAEQRQAKVDSFLNAASDIPVVENDSVFFIYSEFFTNSVQVAGDFNGWSPSAVFDTIAGTTLFYRAYAFESDARLDYKLVVNSSQWILDPRNPHTVPGGFGYNSEVSMPDYVQPEEINYLPTIFHGDLQSFSMSSTILKNSRTVSVYLPYGYGDTEDRYPVLFVHDGGEYLSLAYMKNILDYLISAGRIQPIVAVFVDPVNRNNEYWLNSMFAKFFVEELLPTIHGKYRVSQDASQTAVMGASLGGLTALYFCWKYPDQFGLCGSHSGAFWIDNNALQDSLTLNFPENLTIYMDWGTYEPSIRNANLSMLNLLKSHNVGLKSNEWHEGHSWGSWRAHTDNLLEFLFPPNPNTIAKTKLISSEVHVANYPNPFNGSTRIEFNVIKSGNYALQIYNVMGKLIHEFTLPNIKSGLHHVTWNSTNMKGDSVATGVYFYALKYYNQVLKTGNMLYIK